MSSSPRIEIPTLIHGERLSRDEFERRYEALPDVRAELVEGVVRLFSKTGHADHALAHGRMAGWLGLYDMTTANNVEFAINVSIRLGADSEVQPDLCLYRFEEFGGRVRLGSKNYLDGPPELIAEVAVRTGNYDLGMKLSLYEKSGVQEYIVWRVPDRVVDWFCLRDGFYETFRPEADGIYRSRVFPGLWLDPEFLFEPDSKDWFELLDPNLLRPESLQLIQTIRERRAARP